MKKKEYAYNSLATIRALISRDAYNNKIICPYCDHEFSNTIEGYRYMSVDHKVSQSKLKEIGKNDLVNDLRNLVICCGSCNSSKGKVDFYTYDEVSDEIIEGPELKDFVCKRRSEVNVDHRYIVKSVLKLKEQSFKYIDNDKFLSSIIEVMNDHETFSNVRIGNTGIEFRYLNQKIFSFWDEFNAIYVKGERSFSKYSEYFLKNAYCEKYWIKPLVIGDSAFIVNQIIEELDKFIAATQD